MRRHMIGNYSVQVYVYAYSYQNLFFINFSCTGQEEVYKVKKISCRVCETNRVNETEQGEVGFTKVK